MHEHDRSVWECIYIYIWIGGGEAFLVVKIGPVSLLKSEKVLLGNGTRVICFFDSQYIVLYMHVNHSLSLCKR